MDDVNHNLVLRAQLGDRCAFDALYSIYQDRIVAYCVRLLGDREHGQEVAQDVLVKAWIHLRSYRFESPFANWLIRIATNECRNRYRTSASRSEVDSPSLDQPETLAVVETRYSTSSVETTALQTAYYQHLLHTIRQTALTVRPAWDALDWSIFHLLYGQGISQAREVARMLGMSEDTVKYRIYKRINVVLARVREILLAEEAMEAVGQQVSV